MMMRLLGCYRAPNKAISQPSLLKKDDWDSSRGSTPSSMISSAPSSQRCRAIKVQKKALALSNLAAGFDAPLTIDQLKQLVRKTEEILEAYDPSQGYKRFGRKTTGLPWNISIFSGDDIFLSPGHAGHTIGQGTFKKAWEAIDYGRERIVANLKMKPRHNRQRFSRFEQSMIINEANIPKRIYDQGKCRYRSQAYLGSRHKKVTQSFEIFMDKALGSLEHWRPGSHEEILLIFSQMLNQVITMHQFGAHRDIKPSNFLLFYEDHQVRCMLTDFSFCCMDDRQARSSDVGTAHFLSPLSHLNKRFDRPIFQSLDEAYVGDRYALGMSLFNLLSRNKEKRLHPLQELSQHVYQAKPPQLSYEPFKKATLDLMEEIHREQDHAIRQLPSGLFKHLSQLAQRMVEPTPLGSLSLHDIRKDLDQMIHDHVH